LIRVVDRRRGLPVALGALYAAIAQRVGVTVHGLAFPGHFLMRVEAKGARAAFDPFHDGAPVGTPEMRALAKTALGESAELKPAYFDTVTNRRIVLRLRNNIKVRLLRAQRLREAATVIDGMAAFAPDEVELLREIGLIRARLGELTAARRALDLYIGTADDDYGRRKAQQLLDEIERRLQ
ncbi:MAG: transglutaminase-like domain-containing protein, partial [Pseudomonadota bacterium]